VSYDVQKYWFPYEAEKTFSKSGIFTESEVGVELERVFGMAYEEEVPVDRVDFSKISSDEKPQTNQSNLIGELPNYNQDLSQENFVVRKNAYRHAQEIKLKHYYFTDQKTKGNQ